MGRRERERQQKQQRKVEPDNSRIDVGRDHNRQSGNLRRITDRKLLEQAATELFSRMKDDNQRMLADIVSASEFDWKVELARNFASCGASVGTI